MKIKLSLILIAGMSLASITHTHAGTTQLNPNGTWTVSDATTSGVSLLTVTGGSGTTGKVSTNDLSTNFLNASQESNFNGVTIGKGNGNLQYNTAIGLAVLDGGSATGNAVTGVGSYALQNNTSGGSNTAVGHAAMRYNTAGTTNTASGIYALRNNTVGSENTATGANSLVSNISGNCNTAIGNSSLISNQTGQYNTAIGYQSSGQNQGSWNTTLGMNSLYYKTSGNSNIAIGNDAANVQRNGTSYLTSTTGSIYIGAGCRGMVNGESNSIVIGTGAWGEGSDTTVIGNGATKSTHLYGKTISDSLQVNGNTVLSGTVILAQPQGDISMGAYQ